MKLGLGTGSTAEAFLDVLAPRVRGGLKITGVATSNRTAEKARALGITVAELDLVGDSISWSMAPMRPMAISISSRAAAARSCSEKIVATSAKKMVVIADETKLVKTLGKFPLPVEVVQFGHATTARRIAKRREETALRHRAGVAQERRCSPSSPIAAITSTIARSAASPMRPRLATALSVIPGVVDHGLFVGIATTLIIARATGVEVIEKKP